MISPMAEPTDPYRRLIDTLAACRRVLVTTHVRPDGDALGTAAVLVLGMRKAGVDAEVLLLSRLPRKYAFIFQDNGIVYHVLEEGSGFRVQSSGVGAPPGSSPERFLARYDALL